MRRVSDIPLVLSNQDAIGVLHTLTGNDRE